MRVFAAVLIFAGALALTRFIRALACSTPWMRWEWRYAVAVAACATLIVSIVWRLA
jgi:hypothetical protein